MPAAEGAFNFHIRLETVLVGLTSLLEQNIEHLATETQRAA